jgi:hypothetical protein
MKQIFAFVSTIILFTACGGGGGKKVLVMSSGKVSAKGNTVTQSAGTTHYEVTFVPTADSIIVNTPSGTEGFALPEDGMYILNLKKDTVAGTYQPVALEGTMPPQVVTQENLKFRIDSLYQLMIAYNVADSNKQYNIPPLTIKKITNNTDAEIFGPFRSLPRSFNPALEHEVYKFYTNKEIWDLILKLHKMTKAPKPEEEEEK